MKENKQTKKPQAKAQQQPAKKAPKPANKK